MNKNLTILHVLETVVACRQRYSFPKGTLLLYIRRSGGMKYSVARLHPQRTTPFLLIWEENHERPERYSFLSLCINFSLTPFPIFFFFFFPQEIKNEIFTYCTFFLLPFSAYIAIYIYYTSFRIFCKEKGKRERERLFSSKFCT